MEQRSDRPHVIQLSESRPPVKRLSLPNTVYIEVPGTHNDSQPQTSSRDVLGGSCVRTQGNELNSDFGRQENQNYVEETIYYDQFEDRRIDVSKSARTNPGFINRTAPPVPSPSNTSYPQAVEYNTQPSDDGFRLPPLPVMDVSEPPPAYTEIDEQNNRNTLAASPVYSGQPSSGLPRKLITCPCCRKRVYTIVIQEPGVLTHVIAAIAFFLCMPVIFCIYLTNFCKYKNHYCPNCNEMIGYEIPILCTEMVYTKSSVEQYVARER